MGNDHRKVARVVIFGNGKLSEKFLQEIHEGDYVIGVDRAAYWLIRQGRVPDMAIGDFDSVTKEEFRQIKKSVKHIQRFSPKKDASDMELAVSRAIERKPSEILILGGTGSRMDHTMATWQLLDMVLKAKIPHSLVNETNRIQLLGKGCTMLISREDYRYISILPYTNKISLTLSGFRYNLPKTTLVRGTTRGISNEIAGRKAEVTIYSGKAWVVESND
jgi:thiamine pyrophosphokinase